MQDPLDLTHGWTGALDFTLVSNGAPVDLTGTTVALVLKDKNAAAVSTTTSVQSASGGVVRYSPAAADLDSTKSPYTAHWKVTDGNGKIVFFPNGRPDTWNVYAQ